MTVSSLMGFSLEKLVFTKMNVKMSQQENNACFKQNELSLKKGEDSIQIPMIPIPMFIINIDSIELAIITAK